MPVILCKDLKRWDELQKHLKKEGYAMSEKFVVVNDAPPIVDGSADFTATIRCVDKKWKPHLVSVVDFLAPEEQPAGGKDYWLSQGYKPLDE